jgi:hypothetical protein
MAREITTHRTGDGFNELVTVQAVDQPNRGGASTKFVVDVKGGPRTEINFQNGPTAESVNGLTNEALLAIVQDRLEGFQKGDFANDDSANALDHVKQALTQLKRRTTDRVARGVEGTHIA